MLSLRVSSNISKSFRLRKTCMIRKQSYLQFKLIIMQISSITKRSTIKLTDIYQNLQSILKRHLNIKECQF